MSCSISGPVCDLLAEQGVTPASARQLGVPNVVEASGHLLDRPRKSRSTNYLVELAEKLNIRSCQEIHRWLLGQAHGLCR